MSAKPTRILLVDDEWADPNHGAAALLMSSFPGAELAGGTGAVGKAIEMMRTRHYDVIATDLLMPPTDANNYGDQGGLEILDHALKWQPLATTLVFSALGSEEAVACRKRGTYVFIDRNQGFPHNLETWLNAMGEARDARLGRMVDPGIAEFATRSECCPGDYIHREVAVCFVDLRNSSRVCRYLEKNGVQLRPYGEFVLSYHSMVEEIVGSFDGAVEGFTGDGVMGIFGLGGDHGKERACQNAALCAVTLREKFISHREKWLAGLESHIAYGRCGPGLDVGIGVSWCPASWTSNALVSWYCSLAGTEKRIGLTVILLAAKLQHPP